MPRTEQQVTELNELLVTKFLEVFGKDDKIDDPDPTNDLKIPVIPSFGNNDIMPHNIFTPGPNKWTRKYLDIWKKLIPEEQRHGFARGGWFSVEVIPQRLTVFSLNTLYFFDSNTAVDGCAAKSEPGYEQMEWLRIQLQFLRQRNMKAILMGHVPPARTESKQSWDETCWQKYTLWMQQYRDVIVGSLYGHMNIDHFMLQDFKDISKKALKGKQQSLSRTALDDEMTIQSSADYLTELRSDWSQIPDPPKVKSINGSRIDSFLNMIDDLTKSIKRKKSKEDKFLDAIGGEWAERYSLSLIAPSVVPNYFPTMRVVEYNISNLNAISLPMSPDQRDSSSMQAQDARENDSFETLGEEAGENKRKKHKSKKPHFKVPKPPSKSAPPGPAYLPQTLSWLGYTQYYANLTRINNDFTGDRGDVSDQRWHEGKHSGKRPKESRKHHKKFAYAIEYSTKNDSTFGLQDLSVRSYIDLAGRIGQYKPTQGDHIQDETTLCHTDEATVQKNKKYKKHHGRKHKHRKIINRIWFTFVNRAYVGTRDDEELHDQFG